MTLRSVVLPERGRGRLSVEAEARYQADVKAFCEAIVQIASRLDFRVGSRGWCYLLEGCGLRKGNFDRAQNLIVDCRKRGLLPLDIVAEDVTRQFDGLQRVDCHDAFTEAAAIIEQMRLAFLDFTPFGFWDDKPVYLQALVEKIDLKNLFAPVFQEFFIPFANAKGWSDLNSRAALMNRFRAMEARGKQCVPLYCGDHDPGGLNISGALRSNMADLAGAVGWRPDGLIIDRFGLNHDFIEEHGLTWIDNLETSSGRRLDDHRHPDHGKPYVQDYLKRFGVRKVEANALVAAPNAGRDLCRRAILKYLDEDDPQRYEADLEPHRAEVQDAVEQLLGGTL